jgi:high affinity Mn2+ porin
MRRSNFRAVISGIGAALCNFSAATAADSPGLPIKAARDSSPYHWTGFYTGGHVGYSRGRASTTLSDPTPSGASNSFGSLFGGVQFGYNYLLTSRVLLGVEADISFPNYLSADDVAASRTTPTSDVAHKIDYIATLRGRLGYVFGRSMVYGTGGLSWTQARFEQTPGVGDDQNEILRTLTGWTAGVGTEVAIAPRWTTKLEYRYARFGNGSGMFPSGTRYGSSFDIHTLRLG